MIGISSLLSPALAYFENVDTAAADASWTAYENGTILSDPTVSIEDVTQAVIGWYMCPASVKEALAEYGFTLYLTTATDPDVVGSATGARYTYYVSSNLIAEITSEPYAIVSTQASDIPATVLHEIGHIFDKTIALFKSGVYEGSSFKISDSAQWQDLYARYGETMLTLDSRCWRCTSAVEAFAEMFRMYCESPRTLAEGCPEVYLYIQNVIVQYAG